MRIGGMHLADSGPLMKKLLQLITKNLRLIRINTTNDASIGGSRNAGGRTFARD
jgi:hypothetical protein